MKEATNGGMCSTIRKRKVLACFEWFTTLRKSTGWNSHALYTCFSPISDWYHLSGKDKSVSLSVMNAVKKIQSGKRRYRLGHKLSLVSAVQSHSCTCKH